MEKKASELMHGVVWMVWLRLGFKGLVTFSTLVAIVSCKPVAFTSIDCNTLAIQ